MVYSCNGSLIPTGKRPCHSHWGLWPYQVWLHICKYLFIVHLTMCITTFIVYLGLWDVNKHLMLDCRFHQSYEQIMCQCVALEWSWGGVFIVYKRLFKCSPCYWEYWWNVPVWDKAYWLTCGLKCPTLIWTEHWIEMSHPDMDWTLDWNIPPWYGLNTGLKYPTLIWTEHRIEMSHPDMDWTLDWNVPPWYGLNTGLKYPTLIWTEHRIEMSHPDMD